MIEHETPRAMHHWPIIMASGLLVPWKLGMIPARCSDWRVLTHAVESVRHSGRDCSGDPTLLLRRLDRHSAGVGGQPFADGNTKDRTDDSNLKSKPHRHDHTNHHAYPERYADLFRALTVAYIYRDPYLDGDTPSQRYTCSHQHTYSYTFSYSHLQFHANVNGYTYSHEPTTDDNVYADRFTYTLMG